MKTKLNDNEVKEIVKMQQKIDSYEGLSVPRLSWLNLEST